MAFSLITGGVPHCALYTGPLFFLEEKNMHRNQCSQRNWNQVKREILPKVKH